MIHNRISITKVATTFVLVALSLFALGGIQAQAEGTVQGTPSSPSLGSWEKQAPYPTGFAVDGVDMVSPTEAWAVAFTDIVHTTDGGATWEKQQRPGNDNLYSVDFIDNQHGIAMGNTTLYTRDGGETWLESYGTFGYDVEMADANLAFITDHRVAGYMRSTNGGATWTFRTMPSNVTTIQCFGSSDCIANSPTGTYHTYDAGLNWSFVSGQGGTFASTYFIDHSRGWVVYGDSAKRTTDGGVTWQTQTLPGGSWIDDLVFVDANNGWGVGDNVVRTTDGGATWQQVPVPQEWVPLWDVDFVDAQHGIAGGDSFLNTESIILTTNNGGATWSNRAQGSVNSVLDMVALDRDHAWTSYDYGGKTSRTTDGGRTWLNTEVGDQYVLLSGIDMADLQTGWTVGFDTSFYYGHAYRTTDGGASWNRQFTPGLNVIRAVDALDAQTAVVVGGDRYYFLRHRTTDGGLTWHEMNVPIAYYFYDVFFLDDQTGWMVGGNGGDIVKTTDGGDTWFVQSTPAQYTFSSIHFSDPNNGWAGGYYGTLIHTTDGGNTWTLQDPQIPEYTHVLDVRSTGPQTGWIAGYGGGVQSRPFVKYTTDGGNTWIEYTPQVGPYDSFAALAFLDNGYGWAAGAGGIFRYTDPTCQPGPDYLVTQSSGASIVPGTTMVPGSTCNSCTVNITLPFSYDFYGTVYSSVAASNKGNLQFTGSSSSGANTCLPTPTLTDAILAYWDDLNTNINDTMGIYTSVSGTAPNRIFNIEWRVGYEANDATANFEVRLYEGQLKFEVIYGVAHLRGYSTTIGVQQGNGSQHYTLYSCNTQSINQGTKLTFDRRNCQ